MAVIMCNFQFWWKSGLNGKYLRISLNIKKAPNSNYNVIWSSYYLASIQTCSNDCGDALTFFAFVNFNS